MVGADAESALMEMLRPEKEADQIKKLLAAAKEKLVCHLRRAAYDLRACACQVRLDSSDVLRFASRAPIRGTDPRDSRACPCDPLTCVMSLVGIGKSAVAQFARAAAIGLALGCTACTGHDDNGPYQAIPVDRGDVRVSVVATGSLRPVGEVRVGSQVSGQIAELLAGFNDKVERGQVLARLDTSTFSARVREAEAAVELAEAQVRIQEAAAAKAGADLSNEEARIAVHAARVARARSAKREAERELGRKRALAREHSIAETELDKAQASYDTAAAELDAEERESVAQMSAVNGAKAAIARAQAEREYAEAMVRQQRAVLERYRAELDQATIRSPINGVVIGRDVEAGQTVAASLEAPTLYTLAEDLGRMEVHTRVDEADIGKVRSGQKALFRVDAFPDRTFEGRVVEIRKAPQPVQGVVTYTVLVSAKNPDELLLPGMTAVVSIVVAEALDALRVPDRALRLQPLAGGGPMPQLQAEGGATPGVWVLRKDGSLERILVALGPSDGVLTAVSSTGLNPGDPVVVGVSPQGTRRSFFGIPLPP